MTVEDVEGSLKLNQHKSDADHIAVANALILRSEPAAQEIGRQMVALRPHLDYITQAPVSGPAEARKTS
jgi:transcriptional regulator